MLCVEDYVMALEWAKSIGGLAGLRARADANAAAIDKWVASSKFAHHLAKVPNTRSNTSVCLTLDGAEDVGAKMVKLLAAEKVGYDLGAYRDAPPGLRIWCGATVETKDVEALTHWLDWAYAQAAAA
jgi:phosphoserine aminotransferase